MVKMNSIKGFTLMETLISMLIMSVFFVATTKVITTKKQDAEIKYHTGFYECYNPGGYKSGANFVAGSTHLVQRYQNDGGEIVDITDQDECNFSPLSGIKSTTMYIFTGGDTVTRPVSSKRFYTNPDDTDLIDVYYIDIAHFTKDVKIPKENLQHPENYYEQIYSGSSINYTTFLNEVLFRKNSVLNKSSSQNWSGPGIFITWQ